MNEHDLYPDNLSKDDREALLNKKMEDIRRKNEALQRRHAEIEADKKAAEQKGIAVSLKPPPPEDEDDLPQAMRGVRVAVEPDTDKLKTSRYSSGRGKRMPKEEPQTTNATEKPRNAGPYKPEARSPRKPAVESVTEPPPEAPRNFLADHTRQGPLNDSQTHRSTRNARNYGGADFSNVKQQMQYEKQKHRFDGPPASKEEMELRMTGKERRDYVSWKQERDQIDQERLDRQKNIKGTWKREWDIDKKNTPPTPPVSRRVEPGKRPAGRIGSGRFGLTEERNKGQDQSPTKGDDTNHTQGEMLVIDTSTTEQKAEHRKSYHDFKGGQRSPRSLAYQDQGISSSPHNQRNHLSSEGSDDMRNNHEDSSTLVIEVVNDYSGSGLDGRRVHRGGRGNRNSGEWSSRNSGDWSNRNSGDWSNRNSGDWGNAMGQRGEHRGRGGRGEYRGGRGDYRGSSGDYRHSDRGGIRGGGGTRGEYYRGRGDNRGSRGEYRGRGIGNRGEYRGRGGERGSRGGRGAFNRDSYEGAEYNNYGGYRGNRGSYRGDGSGRGRGPRGGGRRGGRDMRYDDEEDELPILGTVVIDTSVKTTEPTTSPDNKPSKAVKKQGSPVRRINSGDAPLSPQSDASGSWATTDSQGEWEDDECHAGDEFDDDDQMDQYEEDDYWEEGLELQNPNVVESYPMDAVEEHPNAEMGIPADEDTIIEQDDVHNSSSESLERFIQEHTLQLNVKTGNLETAADATPPNVNTPPNEVNEEVVSPFSPMKTPEGHVHVLDWAADGSSSLESTPQKNMKENLDLSTSFSNSENNESLDKSKNDSVNEMPVVQEEKAENVADKDSQPVGDAVNDTKESSDRELCEETVKTGDNTENIISQAKIGNTENVIAQTEINNTENIISETEINNTENVVLESEVNKTENVISQAEIGNTENVNAQTEINNITNDIPQAEIGNTENGITQTEMNNTKKGISQAEISDNKTNSDSDAPSTSTVMPQCDEKNSQLDGNEASSEVTTEESPCDVQESAADSQIIEESASEALCDTTKPDSPMNSSVSNEQENNNPEPSSIEFEANSGTMQDNVGVSDNTESDVKSCINKDIMKPSESSDADNNAKDKGGVNGNESLITKDIEKERVAPCEDELSENGASNEQVAESDAKTVTSDCDVKS